MNAATRIVFRMACLLAPPTARHRLRAEWAADLDGLVDDGTAPFPFALGLLVASVRLRVAGIRRARLLALVTSASVLIAAACVASVVIARPTCATPKEVLGVVAGPVSRSATHHLPQRVIAAARVIRQHGGYEGVWVAPDGDVFIGVYGPAWSQVRAAATAVSALPGPRITYVCQPATERQLLAAQDGVGRSPLWQQRLIGFSDIDVQNATVTVALKDTAPASTEAELIREDGPRLVIERSHDPFPDMSPGRGRMPIAATTGR